MLGKTKQGWGRVVITAAASLILCPSKKASSRVNKGLYRISRLSRRKRCSRSNQFKSEKERGCELARNFIGTVAFTLDYMGRS